MIMDIRTIMTTIMGMGITNMIGTRRFATGPDDIHPRVIAAPGPTIDPERRTRWPGLPTTATDLITLLSFLAALLAPPAPAQSQSNETLRAENEYRECLYSKTRKQDFVRGERDSDFKLLGECRNQWVAYMDVCAKVGFDNATCVMKSRLIIHAILDLTGK
jgi:hypothetical protein